MQEKMKIDVSFSTMVKIVLALLLFYLLFVIRDILLLILITLILVAALRPTVNKWSKKIGRTFSVLILLVILLGVLTAFIYLVVPPMVEQIKQLANNFPEYVRKFAALRSQVPYVEKLTNTIAQSLGSYAGNFISFTSSFFGGLFTFLTIIVLTVYILIDDHIFTGAIKSFFSGDKREEIVEVVNKLSDKVGEWLRGQLLLGLIMGVVVYVGLSIIGLPYALIVGVLAALLEIVPIIGPVISGGVAVLIALSIHPVTAVIVVIFFVILHQLEGNLLVPKIMQKAIGLSPAILIIAMLIGAKLLGIVGAILALPVAGMAYVVFQEWDTIKTFFKK